MDQSKSIRLFEYSNLFVPHASCHIREAPAFYTDYPNRYEHTENTRRCVVCVHRHIQSADRLINSWEEKYIYEIMLHHYTSILFEWYCVVRHFSHCWLWSPTPFFHSGSSLTTFAGHYPNIFLTSQGNGGKYHFRDTHFNLGYLNIASVVYYTEEIWENELNLIQMLSSFEFKKSKAKGNSIAYQSPFVI